MVLGLVPHSHLWDSAWPQPSNSSSSPTQGRPSHPCLDHCSHIFVSGLLAPRTVLPLPLGSFLPPRADGGTAQLESPCCLFLCLWSRSQLQNVLLTLAPPPLLILSPYSYLWEPRVLRDSQRTAQLAAWLLLGSKGPTHKPPPPCCQPWGLRPQFCWRAVLIFIGLPTRPQEQGPGLIHLQVSSTHTVAGNMGGRHEKRFVD